MLLIRDLVSAPQLLTWHAGLQRLTTLWMVAVLLLLSPSAVGVRMLRVWCLRIVVATSLLAAIVLVGLTSLVGATSPSSALLPVPVTTLLLVPVSFSFSVS